MASRNEKNLDQMIDKITEVGRAAPVTLRNDERVDLALTETVALVPEGASDGPLMPIAAIVRSAAGRS